MTATITVGNSDTLILFSGLQVSRLAALFSVLVSKVTGIHRDLTNLITPGHEHHHGAVFLAVFRVMLQACRPKHKVLVLKCYPKYQKTVVDLKPNQSELSYLLYYATTRRSKLPKVGAFLERKTVRDVRHGRTWCVTRKMNITGVDANVHLLNVGTSRSHFESSRP